MSEQQAPKSLALTLYDGRLKPLAQIGVPLSVSAPAVNRLLQEVPYEKLVQAKELWYFLRPSRPGSGKSFIRAPTPVGACSLYGTQYVPEQEPPPRVSHHPQPLVEFFTVTLKDFDDEIFRGDYSVDDLFRAWVEHFARLLLEKGTLRETDLPLYYDMDLSLESVQAVEQDLFPDDAYKVEGVFQLPRRASTRKKTVFRKVATPPLPRASRTSFGAGKLLGRSKKRRGTVLLRPEVYRELLEVALSDTVENGGYLLGNSYRTPTSPESEDDPAFKWTLEITDVLLANSQHGTPGRLLFNGDTWSAMRRTAARDFPDRQVVSWFHTHLFAGSDDFGLSGLDQELHRQFFSRPWHVAILINIDSNQQREVRCFQKGDSGDLVECKFEVLEEEGDSDE